MSFTLLGMFLTSLSSFLERHVDLAVTDSVEDSTPSIEIPSPEVKNHHCYLCSVTSQISEAEHTFSVNMASSAFCATSNGDNHSKDVAVPEEVTNVCYIKYFDCRRRVLGVIFLFLSLSQDDIFLPWDSSSLYDGLGWDLKEGRQLDLSIVRLVTLPMQYQSIHSQNVFICCQR